jgi:S-adenosylmethionine/arginine decarboxylase-like enzyme
MAKTVCWGWHLSVNASYCDLSKITDRDNIYNFIKQLVNDIDMIAYGEPEIVFFGNGDKSGFTSTQLISTSNICAHYVDEYKAVFLDVFSCKDFDQNTVVELVKKYFGSQQVTTNLNTRECQV